MNCCCDTSITGSLFHIELPGESCSTGREARWDEPAILVELQATCAGVDCSRRCVADCARGDATGNPSADGDNIVGGKASGNPSAGGDKPVIAATSHPELVGIQLPGVAVCGGSDVLCVYSG